MPKKKAKEEHITVLPDTFDKLKYICKHEVRSYRGEVTKLIDEKYTEVKRRVDAKG